MARHTQPYLFETRTGRAFYQMLRSVPEYAPLVERAVVEAKEDAAAGGGRLEQLLADKFAQMIRDLLDDIDEDVVRHIDIRHFRDFVNTPGLLESISRQAADAFLVNVGIRPKDSKAVN